MDVYRGPTRNMLRETSLRVVGGGGDPASMDYAEATAAETSALAEDAKIGGVLTRYGLTAKVDRAALQHCMGSAKVLATCPDRIKAAALDLLQVPAFEGDPQLEGLDDDLKAFADRAEIATTTADAGDKMVTPIRFTIRNAGAVDRLVTGIRLRLREVFYAQGDGSVGEQPVALQAQPAGSVKIRQLFLAECTKPAAVPTIEIALPGPVPVKAGGANLFELKIDTASRRAAAADVVSFDGVNARDVEPVPRRCTKMRASRTRLLGTFPRYATAFRILKVPMFESYQNSAVEVAIRDDRGVWTVLGTINFSLP